MAMPNDLILVRHGESEPNVVHRAEKNGEPTHPSHTAVYERDDWLQRLSTKGIGQAKAAGEWLRRNGWSMERFDRRYASPFMRARETAYHIGGEDALWHLDDRIKERDWGEFGATPKDIRDAIFPYAAKSHENNKWYARLSGGESLADGVLMRARDFVGTLHRDLSGQSALVVSHGEFMWTMRYLIERMLPEEWLAREGDKAEDMKNCTILHYSRVNPDDPTDISPHLTWMRMVYPYDEAASPFGGKWVPIREKRLVSGKDLCDQLGLAPPLISE